MDFFYIRTRNMLKLIKRITPLILVILFLVVMLVWSLLSKTMYGEVKGLLASGSLIAIVIAAVLDFIFRSIFKKAVWLWVAESVAILAAIYVWILQ